MCHKRQDVFLAKISLKLNLTKLQKPSGHEIKFCSTKILCASASAHRKLRGLYCSGLLGSRWLWCCKMLIHEIELSCWEKGKLGGLNEGCKVCMDFCTVILSFTDVVFCKYFGKLLQSRQLGKLQKYCLCDFSRCTEIHHLHFINAIRALVFPNRLCST